MAWSPLYDVLLPMLVLSFALVGALIASHQPSNWIGWICLAMACLAGADALFVVYSLAALLSPTSHLAGGLWTLWVVQWIWLPLDGLGFVFLPAFFPTGRLVSSSWRPVLWLGALSVSITMLVAAVYPVMGLGVGGPSCVWSAAIPGPCHTFHNPFPIYLPKPVLDRMVQVCGGLESSAVICAVASLYVRYRRGNSEVRAQLKWLTSAFAVCALAAAGLFVSGTLFHVEAPALWIVLTASFVGVPLSIGFAILKYRIYDIDLIISKSLVYGTLAAFIGAVYVAIVVGLGTLIGTRGQPNLGLSIVATAVVAVAFQPIRERAQRIANRLVYGERASPYEVMAEFASRMAGVVSLDELLPRIAEAAAQGVGASYARVGLVLSSGVQQIARWPDPSPEEQTSFSLPVVYGREELGEIAVAKQPIQSLTPGERKLLADLAAQAGLALHNVQLAMELQGSVNRISAQAAAIRASRQRIVAAQDSQRRRLEHTIHQGVEPQLVALRAELARVEQSMASDPQTAAQLLDQLAAGANATLEELRDVARGVYPPLLSERGLGVALSAQIQKLQLPVVLSSEGLDRYPVEVEAAAYFSCMEALHSADPPVSIRLSSGDGALEFTIRAGRVDLDGRSQEIEDRIEALGGQVAISDQQLTCRIPVRLGQPAL
jgi:signal transduction histidine kinase